MSHAKKCCAWARLGVAPVYPQARGFKERGAYVIGVLGFRNKAWSSGRQVQGLLRRAHPVHGRRLRGHQSMVTEGIKQAIAKHSDIDEVVRSARRS